LPSQGLVSLLSRRRVLPPAHEAKASLSKELNRSTTRRTCHRANIPDKLAEALSKVARDYKRLQAQVAALDPDNSTAKALVEQAKPEIEAGHFQRARELLRQATQAQIAAAQAAEKLEAQAHAARDAQMLGAASSTAAEGDVALTERRYDEAEELFGQAAGYVPSGHAGEQGGYLMRQEEALYRQGDERSDNAALRSAIEVCKRVLSDHPDRVPLQWASTQMGLGSALKTLGERESGTESLNAAVAAYRSALQENTRDRVPLQWASTQMNLGNALFRLGERESGTESLNAAVAAYRSALQENTRDRIPLQWAYSQHGLASTLAGLADRTNNATLMRQAVSSMGGAVDAYRQAGDAYWLPIAEQRLAEMQVELSNLQGH
jgi:tetratricopeptide (TPR) repeat protein